MDEVEEEEAVEGGEAPASTEDKSSEDKPADEAKEEGNEA